MWRGLSRQGETGIAMVDEASFLFEWEDGKSRGAFFLSTFFE